MSDYAQKHKVLALSMRVCVFTSTNEDTLAADINNWMIFNPGKYIFGINYTSSPGHYSAMIIFEVDQ